MATKPDWVKAHLRLGGALAGLKRWPEAKAAYTDAQRCEPSNAQIGHLISGCDTSAATEAEIAADTYDWMADINESVPPNPFYEQGLAQQDDAPMVFDYRNALNEGLKEVTSLEGPPVMRTPKGVALVVDKVLGSNFEKLVLLAKRKGGGATKGAKGPLAAKLWHMKMDWRDEGTDDEAIAERMTRRATAEHTRIKQLSGCAARRTPATPHAASQRCRTRARVAATAARPRPRPRRGALGPSAHAAARSAPLSPLSQSQALAEPSPSPSP